MLLSEVEYTHDRSFQRRLMNKLTAAACLLLVGSLLVSCGRISSRWPPEVALEAANLPGVAQSSLLKPTTYTQNTKPTMSPEPGWGILLLVLGVISAGTRSKRVACVELDHESLLSGTYGQTSRQIGIEKAKEAVSASSERKANTSQYPANFPAKKIGFTTKPTDIKVQTHTCTQSHPRSVKYSHDLVLHCTDSTVM